MVFAPISPKPNVDDAEFDKLKQMVSPQEMQFLCEVLHLVEEGKFKLSQDDVTGFLQKLGFALKYTVDALTPEYTNIGTIFGIVREVVRAFYEEIEKGRTE